MARWKACSRQHGLTGRHPPQYNYRAPAAIFFVNNDLKQAHIRSASSEMKENAVPERPCPLKLSNLAPLKTDTALKRPRPVKPSQTTRGQRAVAIYKRLRPNMKPSSTLITSEKTATMFKSPRPLKRSKSVLVEVKDEATSSSLKVDTDQKKNQEGVDKDRKLEDLSKKIK